MQMHQITDFRTDKIMSENLTIRKYRAPLKKKNHYAYEKSCLFNKIPCQIHVPKWHLFGFQFTVGVQQLSKTTTEA